MPPEAVSLLLNGELRAVCAAHAPHLNLTVAPVLMEFDLEGFRPAVPDLDGEPVGRDCSVQFDPPRLACRSDPTGLSTP